ncbi:MAG: Nif11-like leader peptide family RiPP precursor [Candidatus Eremiobacteraeota bacterium]|nr:Nif11-like leader peptide family RiPP precursor [Candidatus Eremiobacteraeota bacterium]
MSLEKAKDALKKIMNDPDFSRKMINVKSDQEAIELLSSHGFKFTKEEFEKAKHEMRQAVISDAELAGVAGGSDSSNKTAYPVANSVTVGAAAAAF